MDENRLQADLKLIQALLDCPSGEKAQILATNRNIVDAGLVESKKNTNAANLLIKASRLDSQFRFFIQVLEATRYRYKSPQKLYQLLQANLELLDDDFIIIMRCWATVKLAEVEPQQAQEIAANISNFSNLMQRFALGKQTNMEIAILSTGVAIAMPLATTSWYRNQECSSLRKRTRKVAAATSSTHPTPTNPNSTRPYRKNFLVGTASCRCCP